MFQINPLFTTTTMSSSPSSRDPAPSNDGNSHHHGRRGFPDFFDPTTLTSLSGSSPGGGRTGALRMGRRSRSGIQFKDDAGYIGYISDGDACGDGGGGDEGSFRNHHDLRISSSRDFLQIRRELIGSHVSFTSTTAVLILVILGVVYFVAFVKRMMNYL